MNFSDSEIDIAVVETGMGGRLDSTNITPDSTQGSNDYLGINANILTSYNLNEASSIFLGLGQATRVPDARELYMMPIANANLKQTRNRELDLGYELNNETIKFKVKGKGKGEGKGRGDTRGYGYNDNYWNNSYRYYGDNRYGNRYGNYYAPYGYQPYYRQAPGYGYTPGYGYAPYGRAPVPQPPPRNQ